MDKLVLVTLVSTALVLPLVGATHTPTGRCDGEDTIALGIIEITGGTADTTAYIDDRNFVQANGIWFYTESNNIWTSHGGPGVFQDDIANHNLQRGGSSPIIPDDNEICVDDPTVVPDQLWV